MKRIFYLLLLLWLPCGAAHAQIAASRIEVAVPAGNAALDDLAGGVQHALQRQFLLPVTIRRDIKPGRDARSTLLVAIGDPLLPQLAEHRNRYAAAIALQVTSGPYLALFGNQEKVTALFRDQPLQRQLQLAKLLLPNLRRVGIIHGHQALPLTPAELQRRSGLGIDAIDIEGHADWPKYLSQLMLDNDVLLGIDDGAIYNRNTIRSILLTTYRRGKFLIGPSRSFVSAGSLASCYTAPDQFLQQLIDMTAELLRAPQLPEPQYPRSFRVAVNAQVAASLGLAVPDEQTLTARLQNAGRPDPQRECGDGC